MQLFTFIYSHQAIILTSQASSEEVNPREADPILPPLPSSSEEDDDDADVVPLLVFSSEEDDDDADVPLKVEPMQVDPTLLPLSSLCI